MLYILNQCGLRSLLHRLFIVRYRVIFNIYNVLYIIFFKLRYYIVYIYVCIFILFHVNL